MVATPAKAEDVLKEIENKSYAYAETGNKAIEDGMHELAHYAMQNGVVSEKQVNEAISRGSEKYEAEQTKEQPKTEKGGKSKKDKGDKSKGDKVKPPRDWGMKSSPGSVRLFVIMIRLLQLALFVAFLFFAFLNLRPYISIVAALTEQPEAATSSRVVGFALWMGLQIFQLLPTVLESYPELAEKVAAGLMRRKSLAITKHDNAEGKALKERSNQKISTSIKRLGRIKLAAYGLDAALCIFRYPPVVGGLGNVVTLILAGAFMFGDIDWNNVALILSAMFAVELLFTAWNAVNGLLELTIEREEG